MLDATYFLGGLREQVDQLDGKAVVRIALHSGAEYYVRDVVHTGDGFVMLNVYHGREGRPIVSSSSSAYAEDVPSGFHPVSISFESISNIDVLPTSDEDRRRIGFNP